ncbi:hypothetical protein K1X76_07460 [bacterium]|nr:hypothetical protein [bacterium]
MFLTGSDATLNMVEQDDVDGVYRQNHLLELTSKDGKKTVFELQPSSEAHCAVLMPDKKKLLVSGVSGGSGTWWLKEYNISQKKPVQDLSKIISSGFSYPLCIQLVHGELIIPGDETDFVVDLVKKTTQKKPKT